MPIPNDNRGIGRDGVYDDKRDWFYQNVRLIKALTQKGYDVNYPWSMNLRGQKFGGMILPEMMRWLRRNDGVSPIRMTRWKGRSANPRKTTMKNEARRILRA